MDTNYFSLPTDLAFFDLFDDVYMPLLKIILAMLQEKLIKVEASPFQQLFRRILSLYIVECVGRSQVLN
jgi:hypothetical protein